MWKSINADYKASLNNLYLFCTGKVETYYLRQYLELRPNANATVEAGLPEECAILCNGTFNVSRSNPQGRRNVVILTLLIQSENLTTLHWKLS